MHQSHTPPQVTVTGNVMYLPFGGAPISFDTTASFDGRIADNVFEGAPTFTVVPRQI